ncbi:MAG: helix-turn-helix domain-containing protein [Puniceicoccaceae bacterium]
MFENSEADLANRIDDLGGSQWYSCLLYTGERLGRGENSGNSSGEIRADLVWGDWQDQELGAEVRERTVILISFYADNPSVASAEGGALEVSEAARVGAERSTKAGKIQASPSCASQALEVTKRFLQRAIKPVLEDDILVVQWVAQCLSEIRVSQESSVRQLKAADRRLMGEIADYLGKFPGEGHSLDSIAKRFSVNSHKLKRDFKLCHGQTVFEFLRQKRIEEAARLLKEGSLSVLEVALACGYANPGHFARAFKEETGLNPKLYQMRRGGLSR